MASQLETRDSFSLLVEDVSGQKEICVAGVSPDMTVAELTEGLIPKLELPNADPEGRPVSYHVRSDRQGRHLHATEVVGRVLEPNERIVLQPNVQAG